MLYNYFNQKNLYDCILNMKVFSMIPDSKDYKPIDVTINNFDENIFYSNVFFSDYLHNHAFTFHCFNDGNIEILKTLEEGYVKEERNRKEDYFSSAVAKIVESCFS